MRLGGRVLGDIVAGVAAVGMFEAAKVPDPAKLKAKTRRHCVGVAALSKQLAQLWKFEGVEQIFLAGLLHDLGKLLSLQCGEIRYHEMPAEVLSSPHRMHIEERRSVGYDHAVLAAHVLAQWNFPQTVQQTVAWHHQPGRAYREGGQVGLMVALLRLADVIDVRLAAKLPWDEEFAHELSLDGTLEYSGLSLQDLRHQWSSLSDCRTEMIRAVS